MVIKRVTDDRELAGIRNLQESNLKKNLKEEEWVKEGFVTAEYSLDFLRTMHAFSPSIVAKDGDEIAGYVITVTKHIRNEHLLLKDLFDAIDSKVYQNRKMPDMNYVLVGQLCVSKKYRGQQLSSRMYNFFKAELQEEFECCLTDVDEKNPRSLRAHLRSGFTILDTLTYGGSTWHIVLWDWRK
jgi:predicted N-acetyltransferase YhbS